MAVKRKWVAQLRADGAKFEQDLKKSSAAAVEHGRKISISIDEPLKKAALTATAAAAAIAAVYVSAAQAGDQAAKTADKLGLTTQALGGLRHAAELSGAGANTLDMGLQRMTRRVSAAAQGTGEAVKALDELGLSATALNEMSPDQQFSAIADAMGKVEDQGDKVRLTFALFDSEGVNLVNTMAMGSAGLAAATKEAELLGTALSRPDAAKMEAANDAMYRAGQVAKGAANTVAVELAPYVEAVANHFFNAALEAGGFSDVVSAVVDRAVSVIGFAADGVRGLQLAWLLVKVGSVEAVESGLVAITKMDAAVASFLDKIPGMSFIPDQDNIAYLKYMSETAQAARADLDAFTQELLTTGLPSDQIAKMAGQITRQAQEAADIVAAAASGNKVSGFDNGAEQEAASKAFTDTVAANDALIQEHMRLTDNLVSLDHYRYEQKRIAIDQQIADAQARGGSELDLIEQLNVQKELLHKNHLAKLKKDEDKAAEAKKKQGIANAKHGLNQMTESLAAVSQHSKDAFHAWKITATAKAIVDTYTAATGAYAAMAGITGVGPALGAAAAAAAVAAGLANVQAIKNTQYGSSSASASTPSGVSASSVSVPANGPSGPTDYSPPSAGERTGAPLVSITIAGDVVSDSAEWFAEKMTEVVERRLISAEIRGAA